MSKFCLNYIPEIILDTFCCCLKPKEWSNLQSSKLLKSTTYASCSKVLINNCRLFHCRPKPKEWSYSHFNCRVQSSPKSNLHLVPWPDIQEPIGHWISSSNYKFSTLFELFMAIHGLTNSSSSFNIYFIPVQIILLILFTIPQVSQRSYTLSKRRPFYYFRARNIGFVRYTSEFYS